MSPERIARLRRKIKAQGCNGEIASFGEIAEWRPRADQTQVQIDLAHSIIASYDDGLQQLSEEKEAAVLAIDSRIQKAILLVILDEINLIRSKLVPALGARTILQLKNAVIDKINT